MAVHFECEAPQALLRAFDECVMQSEPTGKSTTWEKHQDGKHYTHRAAEWARRAWFKAEIQDGRLSFYLVKSQDQPVTSRAYAYYHGHLIETFLAHFDKQFLRAAASALPERGDLVQ